MKDLTTRHGLLRVLRSMARFNRDMSRIHRDLAKQEKGLPLERSFTRDANRHEEWEGACLTLINHLSGSTTENREATERLLRELIICTETLLGYVPKWAKKTTLNVDFIHARVREANALIGRNTSRLDIGLDRELLPAKPSVPALRATITPAPKPLPLRRVRGASTLPPAANIARTAPATKPLKKRSALSVPRSAASTGGVH